MNKPESMYKQLLNLLHNSYAPYSKFKTAAIVKTDKGNFPGVNFENSSLGGTICAERNAIGTAITYGAKKFSALYCISSSTRDDIVPCGMCLQVICEFFSPDTPIYFYNVLGKSIKYKLSDLLPHYFNEVQLKNKKQKKTINETK